METQSRATKEETERKAEEMAERALKVHLQRFNKDFSEDGGESACGGSMYESASTVSSRKFDKMNTMKKKMEQRRAGGGQHD